MMSLWRWEPMNKIIAGVDGRWVRVRSFDDPRNAQQYLELYQRDEPGAQFALSEKRPRSAPRYMDRENPRRNGKRADRRAWLEEKLQPSSGPDPRYAGMGISGRLPEIRRLEKLYDMPERAYEDFDGFEDAEEYLNWLRRYDEPTEWSGYEGYENPPRRSAEVVTDDGRVIHKKLPKGTQLAGGRWDALSIWGDEMAIVHSPYHDSTDLSEFDPEHIAYKLVVFKSNVPASPRLLGSSASFPRNDLPWADQTFTYTPPHGMGQARGQLDKPIDYWVEFPKFSDLSPHQSRLVMDVLDRKGYAEESHRYTLSATKWKKLLGMDFETIQNGSGEEANAAWAVVESRGYASHGTMAGDSARWDALRGVYAVTKKGTLKFIVSRAPKGTGL